MISRIDLRGDALPEGPALRDLLPRADFDVSAALEKVRPICEAVHHRGDAALIDFAEKFDGVKLDQVRVPAQALTRALAELDPAVRAALEESIRRARLVHREQRRTTHTTQVVPGGSVTEGDRSWTVELGPVLPEGYRSARDTAGGLPFRVPAEPLAQALGGTK